MRPQSRANHGSVLLAVVILLTSLSLLAWWLATDGGNRLHGVLGDEEADALKALEEGALAHVRQLAANGNCPGDITLNGQALGAHSYDLSLLNTRLPQSRTFSASDDTYITENDKSKTNETHADMHSLLDEGKDEHGLIRFNTSAIAPGTRIESARLWLYVVDADPDAAVAVHENTQAWDEASANWQNMGNHYDAAAIGTYGPSAAKDHWVSIPVTAAVQRWVNTPLANYGLRLIAQSDAEVGKVASKEHGTSAWHPYLEVVYSEEARSTATAKVRGVLASGVASPYRTETIALLQSPMTLTLQPDSAGTDASYGDASTDHNGDLMLVAADANRHGAIRFDVEQLPTGSRILSASLDLYVRTQTNPGSVHAQAFQEYWTEDRITNTNARLLTPWKRSGGDVDAARAHIGVVPANNQWLNLDVTETVQRWADGHPAYGFRIQSLGASVQFATSDDTNKNRRPRLTIRYACACGAPCETHADSHNDDLLFLVDNDASLTDGERRLYWAFERWGYNVQTQTDGSFLLSSFLTLPGKEVVYVSRTTNPAQLDALRSTGAGVVSEHPDTASTLRIADSPLVLANTDLSIDQTNHPITSSLPAGSVPMGESALALGTYGTTAAGSLSLGSSAGRPSLLALPVGATNTAGGPASSNRVMLPFAGANVWDLLSPDAEHIVRRSLRWAASGVATEVQCDADYAPTEIERRVLVDTPLPAGLVWVEEGVELAGGKAGADGGFVVASVVEEALILYAADGSRQAALRVSGMPSGVTYIQEGRFSGQYAYVDSANPVLVIVEPNGDETLRRSTTVDGMFAPAGITYIGATPSGTYDNNIAVADGATDQIVIFDQDENIADRLNVASSSWLRGLEHIPGSDKVLVMYADFTRIYNLDGTLIREYSVTTPAQTPGGTINADTCQHIQIDRSANQLMFLKQAPVPIAHFPFSEGSGGNTTDIAGSRVASIEDPRWDEAGANGNALEFNDERNAATLAHDPSLALTGPLTISAWIYPHTISERQTIVSHGSYFELALENDELVFAYTGADDERFVSSGAGIREQRWQYVSAISDGATISLVVDGTTVLSVARPDAPTASASPLLIGSNAANEAFDGSIDEVEIYDHALSVAEVEASAREAAPPAPEGAQACATASDDFESRDYNGSTGVDLWTTPWIEVNESDGPTSGDEVIGKPNATWTLRVQDNDGGGEGVERGVDLLTYGSATLSFDYWRSGLESSDYVMVELSSDGGSNWSEVMRIQGPGTDDPFGSPVNVSLPFSVPLNENNRLRFRTWWLMGGADRVFIDNVAIEACP